MQAIGGDRPLFGRLDFQSKLTLRAAAFSHPDLIAFAIDRFHDLPGAISPLVPVFY
jgi:hypothetical protein